MRQVVPLLTLLLLSLPAWAAEPVGEVLAMAGDCAVDNAQGHQSLAAGRKVSGGDTVAVGAGGRLKLRMVDGSVLALSENSRLTIDSYGLKDGRDVSLSLAQGLLRAVVSKMGQPSRFEVGTATAVAAVRSTDWFVEALPQMTRVGVLDGRVSFTSNATHRSVEIPDRFGARVEVGKDPIEPRLWSQPEFDEYIARTAVP